MSISGNLVLVCDAAHVPHHWATWEDSVTLKTKNLISHEIGDASIYRGGVSRMTGERSKIDIGAIIFLKEVLRYDNRVPPLTNKNLFARDLHICGYCGRMYPEPKLSRDHIIPVSKGGQNTWSNVITACKGCNHMKADDKLGKAKDSDGDLMELKYVPYTPSNVEKLILQNRKILSCQMEFLKTMLPKHSRILQANSILGIH